jgi:hypothetical protein
MRLSGRAESAVPHGLSTYVATVVAVALALV